MKEMIERNMDVPVNFVKDLCIKSNIDEQTRQVKVVSGLIKGLKF